MTLANRRAVSSLARSIITVETMIVRQMAATGLGAA